MMVDEDRERKAMKGNKPSWLEGIEGEAARDLIESNDSVIRVVAGPGSGKTTCLKRRTRRLIEWDELDPEAIFVGTFTRAIARELREELSSDINVSTLHSLAFKLLRENPAACQGMRLRFLLEFEQEAMLYDIETEIPISKLGSIHKRRKKLRLMQANISNRSEYDNAAFAGAIKSWLRRHNSMLIGEVVILCVQGLEFADIPSGIFDHVVIDEYQDLTVAEQELVKLIWSKRGSLTVMGDNDQSIYGFRFNHPKGISDFHEGWPEYGCKDLMFSENRRCGNKILFAANHMMAEARSLKPPMLPKSGRRGQLDLIYWDTLDDEISGLARYIRVHAKESFLILVPRRFIGYRLAEEIGVEARTMFREEVLEHPIIQEAFTAASLLAEHDDPLAARIWLGFHWRDPKKANNWNVDAYSSLPKGRAGHELIRRIASGEVELEGNGQKNILKRAEKAIELITRELELKKVFEILFDSKLAESEENAEKRRRLKRNLQELREAAYYHLSQLEKPNLGKVMDSLRFRIATRAPLKPECEEPRVRIMTLHAAKGLEADNVVIAGVADQLIPGLHGIETEDYEEQRRLLYVAVTRAKDTLVISWPRRVSFEHLSNGNGRVQGEKITTVQGVKWVTTSRSSLLPAAIRGAVSGKKWLSNLA